MSIEIFWSSMLKGLLILICLLITTDVHALPPDAPEPGITVLDSDSPANDNRIDFNGLSVGLSLSRAFVIVNNSNAEFQVNAITGPEAPFELETDGCSLSVIGPTGDESSCLVIVRFKPEEIGEFHSMLEIGSALPTEEVYQVELRGSAISSEDNTPPSVPVLLSPINDDIIPGTLVEFSWEESADHDSDSITYHLFYSESPIFLNSTHVKISPRDEEVAFLPVGTGLFGIFIYGAVFAGGSHRKALLVHLIVCSALIAVSCGSGGKSEPPLDVLNVENNRITHSENGMKPDTTYYWKVVADDGNGGVVESDVAGFRTG